MMISREKWHCKFIREYLILFIAIIWQERMLRKVWRSLYKPKFQLADQTTSSLRCWKLINTWPRWKASYFNNKLRFKTSRNVKIVLKIRSSTRHWKHTSKMLSIKKRDRIWRISLSWRRKLEIRVVMLMRRSSISCSMAESRISKRDRNRRYLMLLRARIDQAKSRAKVAVVVNTRRVKALWRRVADPVKYQEASTSKETRKWDE